MALPFGRRGPIIRHALAALAMAALSVAAWAAPAVGGAVTFTKDVAPILQRSCQSAIAQTRMAPMSLITYEEVRPWAPPSSSAPGLP